MTNYEYLLTLNIIEFREEVKTLSYDGLHDAYCYIGNLDNYKQYADKLDLIDATMKERRNLK